MASLTLVLYSHIICSARRKDNKDSMASLALSVATRRDCLVQELAEEFAHPAPNSMVVKAAVLVVQVQLREQPSAVADELLGAAWVPAEPAL